MLPLTGLVTKDVVTKEALTTTVRSARAQVRGANLRDAQTVSRQTASPRTANPEIDGTRTNITRTNIIITQSGNAATAHCFSNASSTPATLPARRTVSQRKCAPILAASALLLLLLTGCGSAQTDAPVVGSPSPELSSQPPTTPGRPGQLRARWNLTGIDLPSDWPDIPLPKGTQVASAYAVDSPPRRTWTASFIGQDGTALELAKPIIKQLAKLGYVPVSAYSATADADAGLFGFTGDHYSVYLMLGEVDGKPNLLITVRQQGTRDSGTSSPSALGSPRNVSPSMSATPSTSADSRSPLTSPIATDQPSAQPRTGSAAPRIP